MTYSEDIQNNNWQRLDTSNLIFIDTNLTDYNSLIPQNSNDAVYLIDSQQNGIEQITETLAKYSNLDSVSIFSHGDEGLLELGNTHLSASNLDNYQDNLTVWGNALSDNGDLLFYGCNVGAGNEGFDFVNQVAEITGADVATSDDLTGNFDLGGDWTLEVATGKIETQTFTLTEYGGLLAISRQDLLNGTTADFNGDGKADIFRQEKGSWDDDTYNTVNLLISNGSGFVPYDLTQQIAADWYDLKGDLSTFHVGDFNGDGKSDLLYASRNNYYAGTHLLLSTGTSFTVTNMNNTSFYLLADFHNIYVGDFNGDGKSDVLAQEKEYFTSNGSNAYLYTSTGTSFTEYRLDPGMGAYLHGNLTNLHVGDFNGDGKADLLRQEKGSWDDDSGNTADLLFFNSIINVNGENQAIFSRIALPESLDIKGDRTKLHVGDFNGDGKDDILAQEKGLWDTTNYYWDAKLLISNGSGFSGYSLGSLAPSLKGNYTNLHIGDFNGDGKDDILRQEKSHWDNDNVGTANILISQSTYFTQYNLSESFYLKGDYTNLYVGDFNGDGRSDLLRQEKDAWAGNSLGRADLLFSTGTNFSQTTLPSSLALNGNLTYLYTNNLYSNHLRYNEKQGLKFNFTHDASVPWEMVRTLELAGNLWSQYLQDDVTINIHVSAANNSDLPTNTLGGAIPFFYQGTSYTDYKNKLAQEVDTQNGNYDDQTAVANLPTGSSVSTMTPSGSQSVNTVAMTRANAKALGFIDGNDTTLDGTIVMNNLVGTSAGWSYDWSSFLTMNNSQINFNTVAIHELGHILGFVSLADGLTLTNYSDMGLIGNSFTALDLYRFNNHNGAFTQGSSNRSLRLTDVVFSIDGRNSLARMSNGVNGIGAVTSADGYQASHWKNEDNAGIMDPLLENNTRRQIGGLDLRGLDVIGWDRKFMDLAIQTDLKAQDIAAGDSIRNLYDSTYQMNRNVEVGQMLADWRWARGSSTSTLRQEGNIAQFLAQQGFFSVGAFRESFDFSLVNTTEDASQTHQTQYIGDDFLISLKENFATGELANNLDLDSLKELLSSEMDSTFTNDNIENEAVNYQDILTSLTQWLEQYENSELNLEDLQELLQQPELVASVVESLDD